MLYTTELYTRLPTIRKANTSFPLHANIRHDRCSFSAVFASGWASSLSTSKENKRKWASSCVNCPKTTKVSAGARCWSNFTAVYAFMLMPLAMSTIEDFSTECLGSRWGIRPRPVRYQRWFQCFRRARRCFSHLRYGLFWLRFFRFWFSKLKLEHCSSKWVLEKKKEDK